jgi:hypothetical protein
VDTFTFDVTRVGIFNARIPVPEGVTVTDVTRDFVEDWRVLPDRTLYLEFKGSRMGAFSVQVTSTREVGLGEAPLDLALPVLAPAGARRSEGLLGVRRDEGLKVETKEAEGCEPMDAAEFGGGASMAYRFRTADRRVVLSVSRREPEVAARILTELRAEQNRVAVKTRLTWTIRYAGVDSFSFLLPAALKDKVRVTGNNIREKPIAEAEEGLVRQRVVLQGKVLGEYPVEIEYDLPYEGLKAGDKVAVPVPVLAVEGVVREEGFYAVWRDPALEILADSDRVEPIDPRELPAGTDGAAAFLAFKYLARPHALTLKVEKHDFLPVLAAVAHHMHLTTVLNEEGTARTEMILALTNNGMQFLSVALPAGARPETLEVWAPEEAGRRLVPRKETPQAGAGGAILVRMPAGLGPDRRFFVKLIWSRQDKPKGVMFHPFAADAPVIEGGAVPVLGTTWFVYPPPEVKVTRVGGSLAWLEREPTWWSNVLAEFRIVYGNRRPSADAVASAGEVPSGMSEIAAAFQSRLSFGGRSLAPRVEIAWADPTTFTGLLSLCALAVPILGLALLRRRRAGAKTAFVIAAIALPLLFLPVAAEGMADVLSAVLFGGLLTAVLFVVLGAVRAVFRRPATPPAPPAAPAAPAAPATKEA